MGGGLLSFSILHLCLVISFLLCFRYEKKRHSRDIQSGRERRFRSKVFGARLDGRDRERDVLMLESIYLGTRDAREREVKVMLVRLGWEIRVEM